MKFTKSKLLETLRRKNEGTTSYQARKIAGVSVRRVNQVYLEYKRTGKMPVLGRQGRPTRRATKEEVLVVKEAFRKYAVSASSLEKLIKRDFNIHIPHNLIHKIMLDHKMAKKKAKKDVRKKDWVRYERRHSLTAVHIDWHYCPHKAIWVFAVLDDASRKLLALLEVNSPTTEESIHGMNLALKHGKIKQCISDHGSQFTSNVDGESKFKDFLKNAKIKQILCKIKHPQSNGKVEKFFDLYEQKRHGFKSKEAFMNWYNEIRPHRSLNFEALETPHQAFLRKLKTEA